MQAGIYIYVLWHIGMLLGNDRETDNEATARAKKMCYW
jgi:hypothetical protein